MMVQDQLMNVSMNKPKLIIRQDDFDFRLTPEAYIDIHKKFIEKEVKKSKPKTTQAPHTPESEPEEEPAQA